jgi:AsmA-like C-terminal region
VKRFVQPALVVVVAVAGLVGVGLLAINLYVQSPDTQSRLREIVSENLGYPISVFRITFTPWNGFHLQDLEIQDPLVDYPILRARDLWIQCNFLPLLRRKLIVRQIYLRGAEVRIPTGERAEPKPAASASASTPLASISKPDPAKAPLHAEKPATRPPPSEKAPSAKSVIPESLWVEIRKFKLSQGSVYFMSTHGKPIVTLRDVKGEAKIRNREYLGNVHVSSATISDSISVDDISSPVRCSNGALDLEDISAQISGGAIQGNLHVELTDSGLPYQLHLRVNGVNINEIVSRAGGILDRAHGILQGSFQLAGYIKDPSQASGSGSLEVKTGYLDQYPILKELGVWTQIDELKRLELEEALSKFSVIGQEIKLDSLNLTSKNCQVNLSGMVDSAQRLDLNGRLTLSQFLSRKIPNEIEENFSIAKDGLSRYLDFRVTGTLLQPQSDLFDRIIGDKGKLLKKILGIDRKAKRDERSPEDLDSN